MNTIPPDAGPGIFRNGLDRRKGRLKASGDTKDYN